MKILPLGGGNASVEEPVITSQSESKTVLKGGSIVLFVEAQSPDGGTLGYQWHSAADAESEGAEISGAAGKFYKIEKVEKTQSYYVVVTNTKDGKSAEKKSAIITITMTEDEAEVTAKTITITLDANGGAFPDGTIRKIYEIEEGTIRLGELVEQAGLPVLRIEFDESDGGGELYMPAGLFYGDPDVEYEFFEKNLQAANALWWKKLDADGTFYANYDGMHITELREGDDWVRLTDGYISLSPEAPAICRQSAYWCVFYYEDADGSGPAVITDRNFVELKPTIFNDDPTDAKGAELSVSSSGLYRFAGEILPSGNARIRLEKIVFDEDLFFMSDWSSWETFDRSNRFDENDRFEFTAKNADYQGFKISTDEWEIRFANDEDVLAPGKTIALNRCGAAPNDNDGTISGLVYGARYAVQLERDESGIPIRVSLELVEEADFFQNAKIIGDVNGWIAAPLEKIDDATYTYDFTAASSSSSFTIQEHPDDDMGGYGSLWTGGAPDSEPISFSGAGLSEGVPTADTELVRLVRMFNQKDVQLVHLSKDSVYTITIKIIDAGTKRLSASLTLKQYNEPAPYEYYLAGEIADGAGGDGNGVKMKIDGSGGWSYAFTYDDAWRAWHGAEDNSNASYFKILTGNSVWNPSWIGTLYVDEDYTRLSSDGAGNGVIFGLEAGQSYILTISVDESSEPAAIAAKVEAR